MSTDVTIIEDEGTTIQLMQGGQYTVAKVVNPEGEVSNLTFAQLSDTPENYIDQAGKIVTVKDDESGVEFTKNYKKFTDLLDTPNKYEGHYGSLVGVKKDGTGLQLLNYTIEGVQLEYFTQLADVENNYEGKAGYVVRINADESGLEFTTSEGALPIIFPNPGTFNYPQSISIDEKGRVTYVSESSIEFPEFHPFEDGCLIVGDGSITPQSFSNGPDGSFLGIVNNTLTWGYPSKLFSSQGAQGLQIVDETETLTPSPTNTGLAIKLQPDKSVLLQPLNSNADLYLRSTNDTTITASTDLTISQTGSEGFISIQARNNLEQGGDNVSITASKTLTLAGGISIKAGNFEIENNVIKNNYGFKVNPGNNSVFGIDDIFDSEMYANKISNGNDIVTKKYLDKRLSERAKYTGFVKTDDITCRGTASYTLPIGKGIIKKIYISSISSNPVNKECSIRISDSHGVIYYDGSDMPYLTGDCELSVNISSTTFEDEYALVFQLLDYTQGAVNVSVGLFKTID